MPGAPSSTQEARPAADPRSEPSRTEATGNDPKRAGPFPPRSRGAAEALTEELRQDGWFADGLFLRNEVARHGEGLSLVVALRGDGQAKGRSGGRGARPTPAQEIVQRGACHGTWDSVERACRSMLGWARGA